MTNEHFGHVHGGAIVLTAYAEAARDACGKYGGVAARYGSDEFTMHFFKPVNEVHAIMREIQVMAMEKLSNGPLSDAIKERKISGTVTGALMQVNFSGESRKQIYSAHMSKVSTALLAAKKEGKRGTIQTVNS